jgi:hypothetical protein|tara:strand:+ start:252 stop:464 length:213 start_codon:yes stop_codon:yes gene_type:complete
MTRTFGKYNLSINLRNGVGIDLEFSDSRPVWVVLNRSDTYDVAQFEGAILSLPFCVITFGEVFLQEDSNE